MVDGESVTPEQAKEWKSGSMRQADYTRKTQELADQRRRLETAISDKPKADFTPEQEQARSELQRLLKPEFDAIREQARKEAKEEVSRVRKDTALDAQLGKLESAYSGEDGRPKFERTKVLRYARQNQIFNPEAAYKLMHEKELIDAAVKQAQKGKTTFREKPGKSAMVAPKGKAPKTLEEARKATQELWEQTH